MTKRLHILIEQRQRLETALADDPRWHTLISRFLESASVGGAPHLVIPAELAEDKRGAEYLAVLSEIESLRVGGDLATDAEVQVETGQVLQPLNPVFVGTGENGAFRTRVNVKGQMAPVVGEQMIRPAIEPVIPRQELEAAEPKDDLTAIRRIDRALARRLNEIGVYSFDAIANWDRYEVRRVQEALDLDKRIWQENWIEQAALLSLRRKGESVAASKDVTVQDAAPSTPARIDAIPADASATSSDTPQSSLPLETPQPVVKSDYNSKPIDAVQSTSQQMESRTPNQGRIFKVGKRSRRLPAPAARRFAYIRGVSDDLADAMRAAGVHSLGDIAKWTRADVRWFSAVLGAKARIPQDQWIEQAALLSRGVWTRYALRVVGGETRLLVDAPGPVVAVRQNVSQVVQAEPVATANVSSGEVGSSVDEGNDHERIAEEQAENAVAAGLMASVGEALDAPTPVEKARFAEVQNDNVAKYDPMRSLTRAIALGKIKRPPPDLEWRWRQPDSEPEDHSTSLVERLEDAADPNDASPDAVVAKDIAATNQALGGADAPGPAAPARDAAKADAPEPKLEIAPTQIEKRQRSLSDSLSAIEPQAEQEAKPERFDESRPAGDWSAVDWADDWDDAEALVIRKVGPEEPREQQAPTAAEIPHEAAQADVSDPSDRSNVHVETSDLMSGAEANSSDAAIGDAIWGSEAEVVIVRRSSDGPASASVQVEGRAEPLTLPVSLPHSGRQPRAEASPMKPPGRSSKLMDRRRDLYSDAYDDDHFGGEQVSFGAGAEEATVTIIRAESSTAEASSIAPKGVANDTDAPDTSEPRPKGRRLGSRFLKALTGD